MSEGVSESVGIASGCLGLPLLLYIIYLLCFFFFWVQSPWLGLSSENFEDADMPRSKFWVGSV